MSQLDHAYEKYFKRISERSSKPKDGDNKEPRKDDYSPRS